MLNYLLNLLALRRGRNLLRPLVSVFHLTGRCNLNCAYCEDFGARRTGDELVTMETLPLIQAGRVLRLLRQAGPHLILTGGEPLLYPHIGGLVRQAKEEHRFRSLTMLTNGLALDRHLDLLTDLDRLVISLDSLDTARWGRMIGLDSRAAQTIIETIERVAGPGQTPQVVINCVVTPETLAGAGDVLDFCRAHNIGFAFSPQSFNNWPHYRLLVTEEYRAFVDRVIARKKRGDNIVGSLAYLRLARDFRPYRCYPTLVPRVLPDGDLIYPCRPIERSQTAHGGRPCNLTQVRSWAEAVAIAEAAFGEPPISCVSCFQQCYAEPSLMQTRPFSLAWELARYRASRQIGIHTFAPG